jgi:hypothetical protein
MAVCVTMDWISFSNFFTNVPLSQHNTCNHTTMYCKYYVGILVFQDVSLVGRCEVFKAGNQ